MADFDDEDRDRLYEIGPDDAVVPEHDDAEWQAFRGLHREAHRQERLEYWRNPSILATWIAAGITVLILVLNGVLH